MLTNKEAQNWLLGNHRGYAVGVDSSEIKSGKPTAFLKSNSESPKKFGFMFQTTSPELYAGARVRMRASLKTALDSNAAAQLWIRVDKNKSSGCFDNMYENRVFGSTEWQEFQLVVNVPEPSTKITFGLLINGTGQAWVGDVSLECVENSVPLTFVSQTET